VRKKHPFILLIIILLISLIFPQLWQNILNFTRVKEVKAATQVIKIQRGIADIGRNGGTTSPSSEFGSTNSTFVLNSNNRYTNSGPPSSNGNQEIDDMSGGLALTGTNQITFYRDSGSTDADYRFHWEAWEYIGNGGGANEFIARGRFHVQLNSSTRTDTDTVSSCSTREDCIPFITGILNSDPDDDADDGTAIAWMSTDNTVTVERGGSNDTTDVYGVVVEFTGSNWRIGHGNSDDVTGDTGTITLYSDAAGTGPTGWNVNDWDNALIFHQFKADDDSSNNAIVDTSATYYPNTNNNQVNWYFDSGHDASDNKHLVHVLENSTMNVSRFTDSGNAEGDNNIDISSVGLTDLSNAACLGSANSSGTGTAYARGWKGIYLTSTTNVNAWAHRNNNTLSTRVQVAEMPMEYGPPDFQQQHYRWRNDNGGEGGWMDTDWGYRKRITISGASGAGTDYQVKLTIGYNSGGDFNCEGNCQTDFDDIRFTTNGGVTELDYWREEYTDSTSATFWVKVQGSLDSSRNIYVYYGNGTATTTSSGSDTFIFFDDFPGSSIDTNKWDTSSAPTTYSVGNGHLKMWSEWGSCCSGGCVYSAINTKQTFSPSLAIESRFSISGSDSIGSTNICYHTIIGNRDVVGISSSNYGAVFRIDTSTDTNVYTFPAKDTWYRISKYFASNQLGAITDYGINETFPGSVTYGAIGLAGDTDANEANMSDLVDWITVRKYVSSEPDFSLADTQESYTSGGATFMVNEDTALTDLEIGTIVRLRFLISNEGEQADDVAFRLEYAKTDTCSSGSYNAAPTDTNADWKIQSSDYIDDGGEPTSNLDNGLTDPVSGNSFTSGELRDDSNTTSSISLSETQFTEIEFAIRAVDGQAESGANYCFRLTEQGSITNFTYSQYAQVTLAESAVISVTLSDGAIAYGNLETGTSQDTTSGGVNDTQTATNNGTTTETFEIKGINTSSWTLSSSSGNEQYVHQFCTSGTGSPDPCDANPNWTALSTDYQTLVENVCASESQKFDLKVIIPTDTSDYSEQSIDVTIRATQY